MVACNEIENLLQEITQPWKVKPSDLGSSLSFCMVLGFRNLCGHFFLVVFFQVMCNRLCKRGTACSLCNCVHLPTRFGHSVFSFYIIIFDCTEYMYFLMQRLKGFSKQIIRFLCVDVCFCCCCCCWVSVFFLFQLLWYTLYMCT